MDAHPSPSTPLVSLVIPVFNAMPYLVETLDAVETQGMEPTELEVILVDDGSDDGSSEVLAEYAERHPNYRLITQPNSGGPADPCNKGIAAVTGKYFFVVGADDVLTERALRDLVDYAEAQGSDIVLAKMAGINGRHAPGSMFKRSVDDAHLVEDKLYNSLTAIKLFRTELVRKSGAYNPTHLRVGSDQPFTLACYLVADKISVRADRPYILIRKREDGKNVTASRRSAWSYAQLVTATVSVIVEGTEPGALRDGILRRPVRGALDKALQPRFLDETPERQQDIVEEIRTALEPYFTPEVSRHLGPLSLLKARLALAGEIDLLRELIAWQRDGGQESLVQGPRGFRLELPEDLAARTDDAYLDTVEPTGVATLETLSASAGRLVAEVSARVAGSSAQSDAVALRVKHRAREDWFDIDAVQAGTVGRAGRRTSLHRAELDLSTLSRGVWDLFVVHRYGDTDLVNRLGRHRAEGMGELSLPLRDASGGRILGTTYLTKGFGNLSIDIGFTLQDRPGPEADVIAALRTAGGESVALVSASTTEPLRLTLHTDAEARGAGIPVPSTPVGDRVLAVSFGETDLGGDRWLMVSSPAGRTVLAVPRPTTLPAPSTKRAGLGAPFASAASTAERIARGASRRLGIRRRR